MSIPPPAAPVSAGTARSNTVCTLCRQRKVACDRKRPRCGLCAKNDLECEYVSTERRPGLRAGFVSRLDSRLMELEARVKQLELSQKNSDGMDIVERNGSLDPSASQIHRRHRAVSPDSETSEPSTPPESVQNNIPASASPIVDATTPAEVIPSNVSDSTIPLLAGTIPQLSNQNMSPRTFQSEAEDNNRSSHGISANQEGLMVPPILTTFPPLSPTIANELCVAWFEKYQPWFPILHQPSLLQALHEAPSVGLCSRYLVIKAIMATTIHHCQSYPSTFEERKKWSQNLSKTVVSEATDSVSLQSIQALLILSNIGYGAGNSSWFFNIIALCKRMSLQLDLEHLIFNRNNDGNIGSLPPRLHSLPVTIIDREEHIRAYWMTEMLDSMSTIGSRWKIPRQTPAPDSILPCSDSLWAFPEDIINLWSFGQFKYSSSFSLCNILVASELSAIHSFLQQPYNLGVYEQKIKWQSEAQQLDERLTNWREEFVAAVFRLINAEYAQEDRAEMDSHIVLTNCLLNSAVIVLFERIAPFPEGIEREYNHWPYATNRCVYACDNMAAKIRRVNDDELRMCNPHLILSIFIAARFFLVYAKSLDANMPTNLFSLLYALSLCGSRWELARKYEAIIRTAVAEFETSVLLSSLPIQFFDLRYSAFELDSTLRLWYSNFLSKGQPTGHAKVV